MPVAFFRSAGDQFVATESTRGPWSSDHQHGGPPAALLVREMERLTGPRFLLARLTFDYLRPVPIAALSARAELVRAGPKVVRLKATLSGADGVPLVHASAVALRMSAVLPAAIGETSLAPPPVEAATPFQFPFFRDAVGYHTAVELRIARGTWGKTPVAAWMRTIAPLVEGEATSPIQRVLLLADSASGIAVVLDHGQYTFLNADLTVALHRVPDGEWLCLDAHTTAEPHGVGLTRSRLWDRDGAVGVSLQNCVVERRSRDASVTPTT